MAVKYLGGNRITGLFNDTKPTLASTALGATFVETDTDDMFQWDGDSWELIASGSALRVKEMSAPGTQVTNWGVIYVDTSNEKLYYKFEGDDAIDLTVGGAANENSFKTIARSGTGSGSSIVAQNDNDTITLVGGTNMSLAYGGSTADPTITFSASGSGTVTVTDNEATNENNLITFVADAGDATGTHGLEMDGDLHYNPSTGLLTATGLSGSLALTGNATSITIDAVWLVRDNRAAAFSFDATGKTGILKIVSTNSGEKVTMSGGLDVTGTTTLGTSELTSSSGATFKPHGTSAGNTSPISFAELAANGSHYVGFKAPDAIAANITWVLPVADATSSGQVLSSNASGVLSWVTDDNGAASLDELSDVTITSITSSTDAAAHIIIYDDGDDIFENKTLIGATASPGISTVTLDSDGKLGISSLTALTALDMVAADTTIFATIGNNKLTIGASNTTVEIAGDLIVTGDTTTVNTATLSVEDPLIILASGNNAADTVDIGFYGLHDTSGSLDLYSGLFRDASDSNRKWRLFKDSQAAPGTTVDINATGYTVGTLVANVEGSLTGNADTATRLATGRTIAASGDITWASASFDGSQNVTSVAAITADVIVNADIKSDASIADSKLATISTADKVSISALNINGVAEIGAAIIDADLFIIDDGGGGANRHTLASRLKTYIGTLGDANQNAFSNVAVAGQTTVAADSTTDTLTLVAGTNITITTDAGSADSVTITAAGASGASESFAIAMAVAL
jgi:hypothetical protein